MDNKAIVFPYKNAQARLNAYSKNDKLFDGKHFEAFSIEINSLQYTQNYAKLKYVAVNFAGLISKVSADMLAGEPIVLSGSNKEMTDWLKNLAFENNLHTQLYESALKNSARGDAIFKVRSGPKSPDDSVSTVFIEDITPSIYFPMVNPGNWRAQPEYQELAFLVNIGKDEYIRIERHYPGKIVNELWEYRDKSLYRKAPMALYDSTIPDEQETGINRSLIIHVPNWRAGDYFGVSDYHDIEALMYAVNNRMTKNENILDKHSDPILALPEGVLDEKGNIRKDKLQLFTIPDNEMGSKPAKPEYITWDASLDNSFKQIDRLIEFLYMTSETSPAVFGMDKQGAAESGRALKLRLMRTIAKINRKKLYYDQGLKEAIYVAQLLAKEHGYEVMGKKLPAEPEVPNITWSDGLPIDDQELIENTGKRLDAGTESKTDAIMKLDNLDRDDAEAKAKRITEENGVAVPVGTVPTPGASGGNGEA